MAVSGPPLSTEEEATDNSPPQEDLEGLIVLLGLDAAAIVDTCSIWGRLRITVIMNRKKLFAEEGHQREKPAHFDEENNFAGGLVVTN